MQLHTRKQTPHSNNKNKACLNPCPEPEEDLLEDRREALFAALGTLLATAAPAFAEYGTDAKISLPNPYQQLNDRMTKQCLVESLGNRECLVYADDASFLYKGADNQVLLERIEKASVALATIPTYVETKQWSKITGVLTGPMGELIRTMGQIADLSGSAAAKQKVKAVKNDLYAMSDGINRKDPALVLKNHQAATSDLVAFVKSL